jgi:hypothetical protein
VFADSDLAAGPNQAFPIVGVGGQLAGQQNLDATVEKIAGALAASMEPSGKNAGVVEDHYVAGL